MVKVLVDNTIWSWSPVCRGCGSALEVALSEVQYGGSGMDAGDWAYYIDCPKCRTQAILPTELQTPFFLTEFRRRHPRG